ncbi:unnamed protein product [Vitrella brassicaformis CCMP3155]|uniref:EamA domain-containing protein n=2 Tax=Vitrella brassicaformis TaxID=1169539 RepID=A0A0G4GUF2_VITBC|nr:unnamed protein product [Vitrella brassicaformis CCMP3155]|eukprot:CEM34469.1 unnamed protein product [Vitrella brassicaformis CCMP3155]
MLCASLAPPPLTQAPMLITSLPFLNSPVPLFRYGHRPRDSLFMLPQHMRKRQEAYSAGGRRRADTGSSCSGDEEDGDRLPLLLEEQQRQQRQQQRKSDPKHTSDLPAFPLLELMLLNTVTVLWGTQHAVIKSAVDPSVASSPALINLMRFAVAALIFLPWLPTTRHQSGVVGGEERDDRTGVWRAGGELGMWMFLGYALQAVGLQETTASRSAFLLYLNVKFVPFLAALLFGRHISAGTWLSALTAFAGTALLSSDGSPPNIGDLWSVAAAMASAMFILRLEAAARKYRAVDLNATSLSTVAVLCLVWAAVTVGYPLLAGGHHGHSDVAKELLDGIRTALVSEEGSNRADVLRDVGRQVGAALYLGIVTTAICNFIQTVGQRRVSAERAAIIYSLDPLWGAIFANLLLGETLGAQGYVGAGLILLAAVSQQIDLSGLRSRQGAASGPAKGFEKRIELTVDDR